MDTRIFYGTKLQQPIGEFYSAVLPARDVIRMASRNTRRIVDPVKEEIEGIQRTLNETRIQEIRNYLKTADASFPNSIILSLSGGMLLDGPTPVTVESQDIGLCRFVVQDIAGAFSVIDGQHRLSGFDEETSTDFDLIVTVFIDLEEEEKAYLFSTINSTQTKVNKSLVYDLFDVALSRSPQRTAHLVAKALNADAESAFYKRIKLLGTNPKYDDQLLYRATLSQGTFVERLLKLITANATVDRNFVKNGKTPPYDPKVEKSLVLRKFWIEDKDELILRVIKSYFHAVANVFASEWVDPKCPLAKTIGFGALMRLLVLYIPIGIAQKDLSEHFFRSHLLKLKERYEASDIQLTFDAFPAAGNGETKLYQQLVEWSGVGMPPN